MRATFPAGTVSGAPKIRAMQIIADLEGTTRGPYGGCVGYFSFNGRLGAARERSRSRKLLTGGCEEFAKNMRLLLAPESAPLHP